MGYYTHHKLTASDGNEEKYAKELSEMPGGYNPEDYLGEGDCIKWYEEEDDMIELSRRYPDVVFRVDGEGEGGADIWVHWYKNGRQQEWGLDVVLPDDPPGPW